MTDSKLTNTQLSHSLLCTATMYVDIYNTSSFSLQLSYAQLAAQMRHRDLQRQFSRSRNMHGVKTG